MRTYVRKRLRTLLADQEQRARVSPCDHLLGHGPKLRQERQASEDDWARYCAAIAEADWVKASVCK
jgi:hypothetical protein